MTVSECHFTAARGLRVAYDGVWRTNRAFDVSDCKRGIGRDL
jgi:hypothetical protein